MALPLFQTAQTSIFTSQTNQLLFIVLFVALSIGNVVSTQGAGGLASASRSSMQPPASLPFSPVGTVLAGARHRGPDPDHELSGRHLRNDGDG